MILDFENSGAMQEIRQEHEEKFGGAGKAFGSTVFNSSNYRLKCSSGNKILWKLWFGLRVDHTNQNFGGILYVWLGDLSVAICFFGGVLRGP